MDIATVVGLMSGFILIFVAMILGGDMRVFWSFESVLITLGGTIAATLMSYKLESFLNALNVAKAAFVANPTSVGDIVGLVVSFSDQAKREGLLSLDREIDRLDDPFLQKGLRLVVDGTTPELIRQILETEVTFTIDRHRNGQGMFETMAAMAPAFGMLGTLIGLVQMLNKLDSPDSVGPGMAVALITTLYGSLLANMVFLPLAQKLKTMSAREVFLKEATIEGVLSIQAGDNPRIIQEKLMSFLSPKERHSVSHYRRGGVADETQADAGRWGTLHQ